MACPGGQPWTPAEDRALLKGRAEGRSFGEIAKSIGRSRGASVSRFHRITQAKEIKPPTAEEPEYREARLRLRRFSWQEATP